MLNEYTQQANDFLQKAKAKIKIEFVGAAINQDWDDQKRNLYKVTLTTPRGQYTFNFWDSIRNTEICCMTVQKYAEKRYKIRYGDLTVQEKIAAQKELKAEQAAAVLDAYDILSVMTKYDPGTFEEFCSEFGYNEDSRTAERIYLAVQKEYTQLTRIFTTEQLEEMQEIN